MTRGSSLARLWPSNWFGGSEDGDVHAKKVHYRRLWRSTFLLTAAVSVTPLVILAGVSYHQYRNAFRDELIRPTLRLTSSVKRSLEYFLDERLAALKYISRDKPYDDLVNPDQLGRVFRDMRETFGGLVDLGVIDSNGIQQAYVGPYDLSGANYRSDDWFYAVQVRDSYVSDVFMGHRDFPHFIIAVKHERSGGGFHILRVTVDLEILQRQIRALELQPSSDAFLVNRAGTLQTPSRLGGRVLETAPYAVPPYSEDAVVQEVADSAGNSRILGHAYIKKSPFVFMLVNDPDALLHRWTGPRNRLVAFLIGSVIVILFLTAGTSAYLVHHIHQADSRERAALHGIEYSNKMASIGRLASGVAHEINNPLAIINEKAGLLKDLMTMRDDVPNCEKYVGLVDKVLESVERCSAITHRLLGFAKHIDIRTETIDLHVLIREVLGFLDKEAEYRDIKIAMSFTPNLPMIESDRGQLQQVFLNIINNAFQALDDGGQIHITMHCKRENTVEVTISDNGPGIPEELLPQIFEPFFTTKRDRGTGLGLSITHGIVEKLGGQITVASDVGTGTSFTVALPIRRT